jgi:hypothetical protein
VYIYPAQEVFCNKPMRQLSDLAGRRTRVSSSTQADFISAVGGTPVYTEFAQIMANMKSGNTDCAVTGTMSGYTLGLHELTSAIYTMPLSWGVAVFAANRESLKALPADLQALLHKELPRLEAAVWVQSEQETDEGIACNTGAPGCGKPGKPEQGPHGGRAAVGARRGAPPRDLRDPRAAGLGAALRPGVRQGLEPDAGAGGGAARPGNPVKPRFPRRVAAIVSMAWPCSSWARWRWWPASSSGRRTRRRSATTRARPCAS